MATLTGAVVVALGNQCAAVLGNDDQLIKKIMGAADYFHERVWQLPLFEEYSKDMNSDYADIKNSVNNRMGGTIRGAVFLKHFIKEGIKWAHLDIAATAWDLGHHAYHPKRGASGAHVRSIAKFVQDY